MQEDRRFSPRFAPVNVGDEIDVKIEAVGEKGDGIAKKDGFVLFVPNTKEGQDVKIRVTKVLSKVGFAEVVSEAVPQPETPTEEAQPDAEQSEPEPATEESAESKEDTEDFGEEEKKE